MNDRLRLGTMGLVFAHTALISRWEEINGRLPQDPRLLPETLMVQLGVMGLATLLLTGFAWLILASIQRRPTGGVQIKALAALLMAWQIRLLLEAAFPMLSAGPALTRWIWCVSIPILGYCLGYLARETLRSAWVNPMLSLILCVHLGQWVPCLKGVAQRVVHAKHPLSVDRPPQERRTVWVLLFDELDASIALEHRSSEAFVREWAEWTVSAAHAPKSRRAGHDTLTSVTAMLSGSPVYRVMTSSYQTLTLKRRLYPQVSWDGSGSLFHELHDQGNPIHVVGWYYPYRALFSRAAEVRQHDIGFEPITTELWLPLPLQVGRALAGAISPRERVPWTEINPRRIADIRARMIQQVQSLQQLPPGGLIWVHWPMPHPPNPEGIPSASYSAGLDLVAEELRRFRLEQIRLGTWNTQSVVVLADHGLRPKPDFPRFGLESVDGGQWVPFLCRIPQGGPAVALPPIRMWEIRSLLTELVNGTAPTHADVEQWAIRHRDTITESRVNGASAPR